LRPNRVSGSLRSEARQDMGGRFLTQFSRCRIRSSVLLALALLTLATTDVLAQGATSVQLRRDWWFRGPGGNYGMVEVSQLDHASEPSRRKSHTSILLGPWRWTLEATAPQLIAVVSIPVLVALFTSGWIRTRRR
jgi:hypothetical protein